MNSIWQTKTNPFLAFTTTNSAHTNCVHRIVTDIFPRSQHRPSISTHDALIKPTPSAPILRWNFRKAHWDDLTKDTCKLLLELPDELKQCRRSTSPTRVGKLGVLYDDSLGKRTTSPKCPSRPTRSPST